MEEVLFEVACGLDVHKTSVYACVMEGRRGSRPKKHTRKFGVFLKDLEELKSWLRSLGCTHVAMESTGPYWKPVYAVLEDDKELTLIVGNATHMANVPGRKTDMSDAEWIARLCRAGFIRSSFVPPPVIRELREYERYRRSLVNDRTAERNRVQKELERVNIKLSNVVSDVFGKSGRAMLDALVAGTTDPDQLVALADRRLKAPRDELRAALNGRVTEASRFLLRTMLDRIDHLDSKIAEVVARINETLAPMQAKRDLLITIPGISMTVSAAVIAELGTDMTVFGNEHRCAAWAGLCPGNNISAGKRLGGHSQRKGNVYLTTILVEAAQAAVLKKGSYYRDKFYRLKARRGYKRAIVAIAHKILVAIFKVLSTNQPFRELGDSYLDALDNSKATRNLVRRLERLGYHVDLSRPQAQPLSGVGAVCG